MDHCLIVWAWLTWLTAPDDINEAKPQSETRTSRSSSRRTLADLKFLCMTGGWQTSCKYLHTWNKLSMHKRQKKKKKKHTSHLHPIERLFANCWPFYRPESINHFQHIGLLNYVFSSDIAIEDLNFLLFKSVSLYMHTLWIRVSY